MTVKHSMLKNSFIYSIGEIFPKAIGFILLPVFTTYLSAEEYGILSYTNAVMMFLLIICSLSLNTYLLREYYECKTNNEKKQLIGNTFIIITGFNICVLIFLFTIGQYLFQYLNLQIPFYPYFSLSILSNFFEVFSIIPLVIFRVKENAGYYVLTNILRATLLFLSNYILIVYFNLGVLGSYYGKLFVNIAFMLIYIYIIYRESIISFDLNKVKKALKFSLPLIPGAIGYVLMGLSDRFILERYVSLSDIGIYSVAYTLAFSITIIIQSGYKSFEPQIYRNYKEEGFVNYLEKVHKIFMFVVLCFAFALSIFAKDILILMTKGEYVKGHILIPVLLIGIICTAQNAIFGSVIIAEKKTKIISTATVAGGFISISLNLILIPFYGIYSAAVTSSTVFIIMNVIVYYNMGIRVLSVKKDIVAISFFMFISLLVTIFSVHNELSLFIIMCKVILLVFSLFMLKLIYRVSPHGLRYIFNQSFQLK